MAGYIVVVPLVVGKLPDGSDAYLYKGATFGSGLKSGEIKRLIAEGFIEALPDIPSAEEAAAEQLAAARAAEEAQAKAEQERFDAAVKAAVEAHLAAQSEDPPKAAPKRPGN